MSQQVYSNDSKKYPLTYTDGSLDFVSQIAYTDGSIDSNGVIDSANVAKGELSVWGNRVFGTFALIQASSGLPMGDFTPAQNQIMSFVLFSANDYPALSQTYDPVVPIAYKDNTGPRVGCARVVYSGTDVVLEIFPTTDSSSGGAKWSTLSSLVNIPAFQISWVRG